MNKQSHGNNFSESSTNMYNKMQVQRQLEQKLESEVTNLSILEDQLQSLLFNKNVGGKFQGSVAKTKQEKKKERKKIQEMYENLNFFDETEKKQKYVEKRNKDKTIQDQYNIIREYVEKKLKDLKASFNEDLEEQIERYSLIISKMKTKSKKEVKNSLCALISQKLDGLEELKNINDEMKGDSYYTQIQNQLNKEKKMKLKQEIM
jgi:hypothetical protein